MSVNPKGQPRRFQGEDQNSQELEQAMMDYIQWCDEHNHLPNIAGFCVHCDITYDTYYQQKNYYPESYKKVNQLLETAVLNNHSVSETMRIFYLKNKFQYADRIQQEIFTPEPIRIQHIDKLSDADLLKLKEITRKLEHE